MIGSVQAQAASTSSPAKRKETSRPGRKPSPFRPSQAAIRAAEEKLDLVKHWQRQFDHRVEPPAQAEMDLPIGEGRRGAKLIGDLRVRGGDTRSAQRVVEVLLGGPVRGELAGGGGEIVVVGSVNNVADGRVFEDIFAEKLRAPVVSNRPLSNGSLATPASIAPAPTPRLIAPSLA